MASGRADFHPSILPCSFTEKKKKKLPSLPAVSATVCSGLRVPTLQTTTGLGSCSWLSQALLPTIKARQRLLSNPVESQGGKFPKENQDALTKRRRRNTERACQTYFVQLPYQHKRNLGLARSDLECCMAEHKPDQDFSLLLSFLSFCFLISSFFFLSVQLIVYSPYKNIYVYRADGFKSRFQPLPTL